MSEITFRVETFHKSFVCVGSLLRDPKTGVVYTVTEIDGSYGKAESGADLLRP